MRKFNVGLHSKAGQFSLTHIQNKSIAVRAGLDLQSERRSFASWSGAPTVHFNHVKFAAEYLL